MVSLLALSDADFQLDSPVSFCFLSVLSLRILSADVSGKKKNMRKKVKPDIHKIAHIVYRQSWF
jgi:hypothetical protein